MTAAETNKKNSDFDSRAALLAAARAVFAKKGYDGATVKELADQAGVNVSLVSYHFAGKEGLYRACLEESGRARMPMAEKILAPPANPDEFKVRLKLFIDEYVSFHLEEKHTCAILHREVDLDLPIAKEVFANVFHKVFEMAVSFFSQAQKKKIIRSDLDPMLVASFFFGALRNLMVSDSLRDLSGFPPLSEPKYREKAVQQVYQLLTQGVLRE